jgi:hypothetical protein
VVLLGTINFARAQQEVCGKPPELPITQESNESLKGQLQGQAKALLGFVGRADLGGEIQATRKQVFQNSPQFFAAQRDAYLAYVFCVLILQDKSIPTSEKIRAIQEFKKPLPTSQIDRGVTGSLNSQPETVLTKYVGLPLPSKRPERQTIQHENLNLNPWMPIVGAFDIVQSDFFGSDIDTSLYSRRGSDTISLVVIHTMTPEASNCFLYNLLQEIRTDLGRSKLVELKNDTSQSYRENESEFTETIDETPDEVIKGLRYKYIKHNIVEEPDGKDEYYVSAEEWLYLFRE